MDTQPATEEPQGGTDQPVYPDADQTDEQRERFFRKLTPGDMIAVRDTRGGTLRFHSTPVTGIDAKSGRFFTKDKDMYGGNTWYMASGKNADAPTGQARAVVPTPPVVAWIKEGRSAELGGSAAAVVVRVDGQSPETPASQAAQQIDGLSPDDIKRAYGATAAALAAAKKGATADGQPIPKQIRNLAQLRAGVKALEGVMEEAGIAVPTAATRAPARRPARGQGR